MKRQESLIIYFLLFIFAAVFLRITGLITFSSLELLSFIFVFSGLAASFHSLGRDRKGLLFLGSTVFLVGILIFINSRFDLEDSRTFMFPSILFILGTGFFLLYLDDTSQKIFLVFSLLFLLAGVIFMIWFRSFAFSGFIPSFISMLESYWIILLVSGGIIFILRNKL